MIPVFKPFCDEEIKEAVCKTLESGWWGLGPKVEEFEEAFAKFVGVKYAVAVNSGTAALHLAVKILHLPPKAMIAMPSLTFISTALAALYNNHLPYFSDITASNQLIDTQEINPDLTDAALVVHYAGRLCPKLPIANWRKRDFPIIEDCAHACGTVGAGLQGDLACWSFHAVKNLAAGDGGMITTNNKNYYDELKQLRWCGINASTWDREKSRYNWDYDIQNIGYKCHMNDITASIGLVSLQKLPELNAKRRALAAIYINELQDLDPDWLILPADEDDISWHMFVIRVPAQDRDKFVDHMTSNEISVGVHYKPLQHYPMFKRSRVTPITEAVWKELVTLPLYPSLSTFDLGYIIEKIRSYKP